MNEHCLFIEGYYQYYLYAIGYSASFVLKLTTISQEMPVFLVHGDECRFVHPTHNMVIDRCDHIHSASQLVSGFWLAQKSKHPALYKACLAWKVLEHSTQH